MGLSKTVAACVLSASLTLSGCVTTSGSRSESVGPMLSSLFEKSEQGPASESKRKLDVVIPIFDPGLAGGRTNSEPGEKQKVWAELRRAESVRFAYKLKSALERTERFGAVRVTPDRTATGDLYVLGVIEESNGASVEIGVDVYDISGALWFKKAFDHDVDESFHKNFRNKGKDPYDPVFEDVASFLAKEIDYYEVDELDTLAHLSDLRFAASFSEKAFATHLTKKKGVYALNSLPSADDPMLRRTQAIRVRDRLFVDNLQDFYREFSQKMDKSYVVWQGQSLVEIEAEKEAKAKAAGQAVLGLSALRWHLSPPEQIWIVQARRGQPPSLELL